MRCAASHCSRENPSGSEPGGRSAGVGDVDVDRPERRLDRRDHARHGVEVGGVEHDAVPADPIGRLAHPLRDRATRPRRARPRRRARAAIPRPIPFEPPVTSATLPSSPRSMRGMIAASAALRSLADRAVSSAGQSACLTSKRSPVRARDRPLSTTPLHTGTFQPPRPRPFRRTPWPLRAREVGRTPLTACSAAPRARAPSRARSRRPSPSPATRAADAAPRTP